MPLLLPKGKKRMALLGKLKEIFRDFRSQPVREGHREDQSDPAWVGEVLCDRPLESVLLVYPALGRDEDSAPSRPSVPTSRLRVEAVEPGMAV